MRSRLFLAILAISFLHSVLTADPGTAPMAGPSHKELVKKRDLLNSQYSELLAVQHHMEHAYKMKELADSVAAQHEEFNRAKYSDYTFKHPITGRTDTLDWVNGREAAEIVFRGAISDCTRDGKTSWAEAERLIKKHGKTTKQLDEAYAELDAQLDEVWEGLGGPDWRAMNERLLLRFTKKTAGEVEDNGRKSHGVVISMQLGNLFDEEVSAYKGKLVIHDPLGEELYSATLTGYTSIPPKGVFNAELVVPYEYGDEKFGFLEMVDISKVRGTWHPLVISFESGETMKAPEEAPTVTVVRAPPRK